MRGELHGDKYRHRAVRSTDDPDGSRLGQAEAQHLRQDERDKDPQMRTRAEQNEFRVGDHRPEVGDGSHPEENQRRNDQQRNPLVGIIEKPARLREVGSRDVHHDAGKPDPDQQERLAFFHHREVNHDGTHAKHGKIPPIQVGEPGLLQQRIK